MSHGQRLGADPLDWITACLPRPTDVPEAREADLPERCPDDLSEIRPGALAEASTGDRALSQADEQKSAPQGTHPALENIWRTLRPKGDAREFKAELSEHLDRTRVADMLEVLAMAMRQGHICLGASNAPSLPFAAGMDVEAAVSLKKDKARLQIELEWKNRKN